MGERWPLDESIGGYYATVVAQASRLYAQSK
jgi:hypothetical protein